MAYGFLARMLLLCARIWLSVVAANDQDRRMPMSHDIFAEKHVLGVKEIDVQHMKIIELTDQLSNSINSGQSQHILNKILSILELYALCHFDAEAELMRRYKYEDTLSHVKDHRVFIDTINGFRNRFDAGDATISAEVVTFLRKWGIAHAVMDKKFDQVLERLGVSREV
jgi:hemerythrin-like metal-binding protein